MTGLSVRLFKDEHDYQHMRLLLQNAYAILGQRIMMTVGDLDYWRYQSPDPDCDIRACHLWFDDSGTLVGFAWPGIVENDEAVIDWFVHPAHEHILQQMIVSAEEWLAQVGTCASISTRAREDDEHAIAVLKTIGFSPTNSLSHWYRVRSLADAIPDVNVRSTYIIRTSIETDAEAIAQINNRSDAGPALSQAAVRAIMNAPTYQPKLHLVAQSENESAVVAFTIIWFDAVNRAGLFEPVACDPNHHRRGLARSLMTEGLRRLKILGATHALVACNTTNRPANSLYESIGFRTNGQSGRWTKQERPAME